MSKPAFMFLSVVVVLVVFVGLIFEAYWVIAIPAVLLLVKWINKRESDSEKTNLNYIDEIEKMSPEQWEELGKKLRKP